MIDNVGFLATQCHANNFINIVMSCSIQTFAPPLRTNVLATALWVKDILSLQ